MSKVFTYVPQGGVCSRLMEVTMSEEGVIEKVVFTGGCAGNTQGISALVKGQKAEDVIRLLKGIDCKGKGTSCPDQLACAISAAIQKP